MIKNGIRSSNNRPLKVGDEVKGAYGNTKAEPDAVITGVAGGERSPVVIIEVKVTHRSGPERIEKTGRKVL
jgi:hypothetical protein